MVAPEVLCLAGMHIAVDGDRGLLAGCDRVDGELRAGHNIAACEHVGLTGLIAELVDHDGAFAAELDAGTGGDTAEVDLLADGGDDRVKLQRLKFTGADGLAAAFCVSFAKLHDFDLHAADLAAAEYLDRSGEVHEPDALFLCLSDLVGCCGHFVSAASVDDGHVLRAETQRRARDIYRDVAAADDCDALTDADGLFKVNVTQKVNTGEHARKLLAGNTELCAPGRADAEVEGLVALCAQLRQRDVLADLNAGFELDAELTENVYLRIHDGLIETEAGDAESEHAAELVLFFKHGDRIALDCKVVRAAQTRGACADDGYLLGVGSADLVEHLRHKARGSVKILIGDELFDIVYRDGGIDNAAGAGLLTGLVADTAADGREGVLLLYELQSLGIASHGGELYVALNGDMRRADGLAGGGAAVHNVASVGAVVDVVGLAIPGDGDVGVIRVGDSGVIDAVFLAELNCIGLAVLNALTAGDTLFFIDLRGEV